MTHRTPIIVLLLPLLMLVILPDNARADVADPTKPLFSKKKENRKKPVPDKPRKPVVVKKEKPETYVLTSTLIAKDRLVAVINDQAVSVGDRVGRAKVIAIRSAEVHLKDGRRDIRLALPSHKLKRARKENNLHRPGRTQ